MKKIINMSLLMALITILTLSFNACGSDDDEEHEHEHEHEHSEGNAWVYNRDFTIPAGQRQYDARVDIPIPADAALGDYHFMIRLTDRAGWQQLHAVAIKITE